MCLKVLKCRRQHSACTATRSRARSAGWVLRLSYPCSLRGMFKALLVYKSAMLTSSLGFLLVSKPWCVLGTLLLSEVRGLSTAGNGKIFPTWRFVNRCHCELVGKVSSPKWERRCLENTSVWLLAYETTSGFEALA